MELKKRKQESDFDRVCSIVAKINGAPTKNLFLLILTWGHAEWENKTHWCERETLSGCLPFVPQPGIKSTTQVSTLNGNRTSDPSVHRITLN